MVGNGVSRRVGCNEAHLDESWVTVGIALTTGAIVAACAHNDASIFIRQVFLPVIPSNGECAYTADVSQASESTGMADVSFPSLSTYSPEVLVGNQIVPQANQQSLVAETSRVFINGAITRITDLDGNTSLLPMLERMYQAGDLAAQATGRAIQAGTLAAPINPFSTVEATSIEPGTGTSPSYAVMSLTMVDSATMNILRYYFTQALQLNGGAAFSTSNPAPDVFQGRRYDAGRGPCRIQRVRVRGHLHLRRARVEPRHRPDERARILPVPGDRAVDGSGLRTGSGRAYHRRRHERRPDVHRVGRRRHRRQRHGQRHLAALDSRAREAIRPTSHFEAR